MAGESKWKREINDKKVLVYTLEVNQQKFEVIELEKDNGVPCTWEIFHMGRSIGSAGTLLRGMRECEDLAAMFLANDTPATGRMGLPIVLD